jgi:hypothetical protein
VWNADARPPDAIGSVIGLKARACTPVDAAQLLEEQFVERYRQQVPGWRIVNNAAGVPSIRQEWTARDAAAAEQLLQQFREVAAAKGHDISLAEAVSSTAVVELTTAAKGEQQACSSKWGRGLADVHTTRNSRAGPSLCPCWDQQQHCNADVFLHQVSALQGANLPYLQPPSVGMSSVYCS